MQSRHRGLQYSSNAHQSHTALRRLPSVSSGRGSVAPHDVGRRASAVAQAMAGQKDVTADLLEKAFSLALTARLKSYGSIHVDVRSTAWGLMEGRFGGMTVRGHRWRTPLELTAEQLMVEVGELVLDYQKLMWQQTVALKNVPQGSVSFTLTSQDLANFMVHPIMVEAARRAVKGHAFVFDRSTARVQLDPATGRGIITYQGVWAGNGQRYKVTMSTPPPPATAPGGAAQPIASAAATATVLASSSNTLEQLTVSAQRVRSPGAAAVVRSTTGSYVSMDEPPVAMQASAAAVSVAVGASGTSPSTWVQMLTVAAPSEAGLSVASAGSVSVSERDEDEAEPDSELVSEGLRCFFSALTLNLQGIELRQPVLLVQLPGRGVGAAAAGPRGVPVPRKAGTAAALGAAAPAPAAAPAAATGPASAASAPLPALLTITMKVAIIQLPPLNMRF